ncbi:uncharacterized protein LOC135958945 isoform X2 [Calliphora vicina]|uniref:uncharacterized protein LOC135958945 isoform X2 n=1 Tax=Calliphora vicina TaxID=7373 RepID=UPI00325A53AD
MKTLRQPSTTKNLSNLNRKCGDITYCIQVGKRVYALNCLYCPQICLQWDIFINHMEEEHNEDLNFALQHQSLETEPQIDNVQDEISEDLQRNKTTPTTFNKLEEPNRFPFNDPLEGDNSTNAMSLESSIKIEKIDCTPIQTMIDDDDFQYDKSEDDKNDEEMDNTQYIYNDENEPIGLVIKKDIRHIQEQLDTNNRLMQQLFEEIKLIQHNKVPHFLVPSTSESSLRYDSNLTRPKIVDSTTAKPSGSFFHRKERSTVNMLQKHSHILNNARILPKTPFVCKEEFLKFEAKIHESEENFANLVKDFKEQSIENACKFIKYCWRLLIKDEVAKEFCWQGSKDKMGIKNFSTLLAIRLSYAKKYTDHSETEFERVVILYFQQAKNRCDKKLKQ